MGKFTADNILGLSKAIDQKQEAGTNQVLDMKELVQWFGDLEGSLEDTSNKKYDNMMNAFTPALEQLAGSESVSNALDAQMQPSPVVGKFAYNPNQTIKSQPEKLKAVLDALFFVLKADLSTKVNETLTDDETLLMKQCFAAKGMEWYEHISLEKLCILSEIRKPAKKFNPAAKLPWENLLKMHIVPIPADEEEVTKRSPANSVLSEIEQEQEENPLVKPRTLSVDSDVSGSMQNDPPKSQPMTFTLNNPKKPKRRESESTVGSDEEEPQEGLDSTETLEFCRYLKVAASVSNKPGNKSKPNDVADALKKLFEKLISKPERTNEKQVKPKNSALLGEEVERMNLVGDRDRKEMLEVLGLIGTDGRLAEVRIEEDTENKTFTIKFYMDNEEITKAGSVVLDSHEDGSWKNIRFNAVDADHGVQLMSDFARKTSQIAQRNDDKPVLKKEVGGDTTEAVVENMFRAIHNKMYPIIEGSQLAAINALKQTLEARKGKSSAQDSDGYILKQIETITNWMNLASQPELNDSVDAGINPYRIAKAMNYLADVHSKLTDPLDALEYSDKPAMQGWIKMIRAVSTDVINNKDTQNTKEKTVSTGVDNVDISDNESETSTRSRRSSSGTTLDDEPIKPTEKPKKTTRETGNKGLKNRFGRM